MSVNIFVGEGHLTKDPEIRYPATVAVGTLALAMNHKYNQGDEWKDEVCFVDITVWGKQAENCAEYLHKGSRVLIEGRLKLDQWQTDAGEKRSKMGVVANRVQFLDGKPKNEDIPF